MPLIPLSAITDKLPVRSINPAGLKRIHESIQTRGFLENNPVTVMEKPDGTYTLVDGNHRVTAAQDIGISDVPVLVKAFDDKAQAYKFAFQSNTASEAYVPNTLVTYAEFVWLRSADGLQLSEIAGILGWSESKVKNYSSLSAICLNAWAVIDTTFQSPTNNNTEDTRDSKVTSVTFTEFLLRDILSLTPDQQLELVQSLASGDIQKSRFTSLAKKYRARNEMQEYASQQLGSIDEEFLTRCENEITNGRY